MKYKDAMSPNQTQLVAFQELHEYRDTQNEKILELLMRNEFVPSKTLASMATQYNRCINDLQKEGYHIKSIKHHGVWGKTMLK